MRNEYKLVSNADSSVGYSLGEINPDDLLEAVLDVLGYRVINLSDSVDIIASGYEWVCLNCDLLNKEIGFGESVTCSKCGNSFTTRSPEHAYH